MQETEILLSYLDPFSQPFYRKFGYERVVAASTVTIPSQRLHFFSTTGDLKLKRKNKMEQEQLSVGYARTLGKQHGSLERENWWLDYQAGKKECKYALVFDSNDVIVGYLSYHFKDNEYYIEEMGYQTQDALKELLNFVVAHKSSFKLFHFNQCYNTDFLEYFEDTRDITTTVTSSMMARIISFSQFMEHLPLRLPNEVKFYLEVIDENCPWNHGVFSLKTVNDEIKCTKVEEMAEGFPVYRGDISRWTQVLMGYLSLEQALELGFLTSNEKEATLSLYLPSERPVLYDHF